MFSRTALTIRKRTTQHGTRMRSMATWFAEQTWGAVNGGVAIVRGRLQKARSPGTNTDTRPTATIPSDATNHTRYLGQVRVMIESFTPTFKPIARQLSGNRTRARTAAAHQRSAPKKGGDWTSLLSSQNSIKASESCISGLFENCRVCPGAKHMNERTDWIRGGGR